MSKLGDIPAFPRERSAWLSEYSKNMVDGPHEGMTYRQWLAGMAMQGYLSADEFYSQHNMNDEKLAAWSVASADALIAELEKSP